METTLIGSGKWLCIRCQVRARVVLRYLHVDHACVFYDTNKFLKKNLKKHSLRRETCVRAQKRLNYTLIHGSFKFANSRGQRHAGKKWRGEINHPWERGWEHLYSYIPVTYFQKYPSSTKRENKFPVSQTYLSLTFNVKYLPLIKRKGKIYSFFPYIHVTYSQKYLP